MRFDALTAGPADGELVLLLHGFPQTGTCWHDALNGLADAGYRAVAPSQRGYSRGRSSRGRRGLPGHRALRRRPRHRGRPREGPLPPRRPRLGWQRSRGRLPASIPRRWRRSPRSRRRTAAALRQALRGPQQRVRMAYIPVLRLPLIPESLIDAAGGDRRRVAADRDRSQPGARAPRCRGAAQGRSDRRAELVPGARHRARPLRAGRASRCCTSGATTTPSSRARRPS